MRTIDAVLFDADGVIQLAPDYLHLKLIEMLGREAHKREACLSAIFAAEKPALTGAASFEAGLEPVLRELGARCGAAAVIDLWREVSSHQPILDVVARLRRGGVYCALASNQERNRAQHMSVALGYGRTFDAEFYSCHLGCAKPSGAFFEAIIERSGVEPGRTLFIDDRQDNVEAARGAGLLAEQFVLWQVEDGAAALGELLGRHGLGEG